MRWADPSELGATREALAAFEAQHPSIRVKLEYTSWGQYHTKLQTLIAGREAPDVFALSGLTFHDLRERGLLTDLTPLVEADSLIDLDAFYTPPVDLFTHGGKLYGLPRDFNTIALFYNRDLFDAAGLDYPDRTWDWNSLRAAARALTRDVDGDGRTDQWGLQVSNDMEVSWGNFVYQAGGRILDDARRHCLLAESEAVAALEFLTTLIHEDRVSPSPIDMESLSGQPFRNGRIAMINSGSWTLRRLDETPDLRYGVASLPHGTTRAAIANGVAHGISSSTRNLDAAWTLTAYLSGEEAQRLLATSGTSIPALRQVAESPDFLDAGRPDVDRGVFLESLTWARTLPFTPATARWGELVLKALDRVWLGEMTPREAMTEVAPEVNAVLAEASGPTRPIP
jgi:multiple sugar transport system substrate-binding protein